MNINIYMNMKKNMNMNMKKNMNMNIFERQFYYIEYCISPTDIESVRYWKSLNVDIVSELVS
jgi:hypothetical protein